ncbi:MAG: DEAD/DEAH box helicase, partial [Acetobacteraceae bacterium]|nr:DEAD/DEAH box helicase [Acetobacteraceae bacterium]
DGPALRLGETRPGRLAWRVDSEGAQRPVLEADASALGVFAGDAWYGEPATGLMGPLDLGLPAGLLRAVLKSPPVPPESAERVGVELGRRLSGVPLPPPVPQAPPQRVAGPPVPCLELFGVTLPEATALARPVFRYGPIRVPALPRGPELRQRHGEQIYVVARDQRAEARAQAHLAGLGLRQFGFVSWRPTEYQDCLTLTDPAAWIDFMLDDVPALRRDGWQVEVAESFPLRLAEMQGEITAELRERSGMDWFEFELGVVVDGKRVDLVPALLDLIADKRAAADRVDEAEDALLLVPLPDGRLLPIPRARVQPILKSLLELFAGRLGGDGALRLSPADAADLALMEAENTGIAWRGGEAVRLLGRQLRDAGGIPHVDVPESFAAQLRPYQVRGVDWLQFLRAAGLGGILADDMGLGKTVQALAHLAVEQARGRLDRPALVVCPTSLVANWRAEAARFAPSLRVLTLHGPDRAGRFAEISAHDLVLSTYPLLARDHATLAETEWHIVVLDEAQVIKNPAATTSKLARTLKARQRLCLSGTPLENHLGELWSLFDFLSPGFLGDRRSFQHRFRTPIEKAGNVERQALLARRVAPFLLRRTKEEVEADLPPKTEITETIEMGDGQRAVYEGIRLAMHAKVREAIAKRGLARSSIVILDALLKLRQACCDPRLLKLSSAKAARAKSAKLERLMEMLPTMVEEGRRVLVFSQFTSMLALIEAELGSLGLPYVLLTGDTKDRASPVGQFQAGKAPLFLISL